MIKFIKNTALALLILGASTSVYAQKTITEGSVTYKVDAPQGSREQKVFFKDNISRVDVTSGQAEIKMYSDSEKELGMIVIAADEAVQYIAAKLTEEDIKKTRVNEPKYSDFKLTSEKQMIGGYNAVKYSYKDDKGAEYELWTTKDIVLPKNVYTKRFQVEGTLVKFTNSEGTFLITNVSEEKTSDMTVSNVPSGYTEMTFEELKELLGQS